MTRLALPLVALSLAPACGFDGDVSGPQLLVHDAVEVHWDRSFDALDDGVVALVPIDVMVYDGATGLALSDVALDFQALAGASVVLPADVWPTDPQSETIDASVWDAWRDRYFVVDESAMSDVVRVRTDGSGLARVYVLADAFPAGTSAEQEFDAIPVVVSMGVTDDTVMLVPR